jgi:L-lactate dehydrogenase (cytochrome)
MHDKTSTTAPPTVVKRAASVVPGALRRYLSLDDFETTARRLLPKFLYGYIAGGAETDAALADNRRA